CPNSPPPLPRWAGGRALVPPLPPPGGSAAPVFNKPATTLPRTHAEEYQAPHCICVQPFLDLIFEPLKNLCPYRLGSITVVFNPGLFIILAVNPTAAINE